MSGCVDVLLCFAPTWVDAKSSLMEVCVGKLSSPWRGQELLQWFSLFLEGIQCTQTPGKSCLQHTQIPSSESIVCLFLHGVVAVGLCRKVNFFSDSDKTCVKHGVLGQRPWRWLYLHWWPVQMREQQGDVLTVIGVARETRDCVLSTGAFPGSRASSLHMSCNNQSWMPG